MLPTYQKRMARNEEVEGVLTRVVIHVEVKKELEKA